MLAASSNSKKNEVSVPLVFQNGSLHKALSSYICLHFNDRECRQNYKIIIDQAILVVRFVDFSPASTLSQQIEQMRTDFCNEIIMQLNNIGVADSTQFSV